MRTKYTTNDSTTQTHSGNGKFSTAKRVSTQAQLSEKEILIRAANASERNKELLAALGVGDCEYSDLFAV